MTDSVRTARAGERWWEGAVLYLVYVRSFADSDGDGFGDLPGVTAKLDYLSWLGVDGLWLSPTMPSPDDDWGYDVSDYRAVHPDLGTMGDLERLVTGASQRGIATLLDLVPNHTSVAHPWNAAARSGRAAPARGYYVWAEPAPGGGPPNNWLANTGSSAWELDEASGQYYLHNFLPSQADLNWWDPRVHTEFEEILRFWFDRGVAGFRIDVAHGLYKDALLRDDPAMPAGTHARAHRYGLLPRYSANRPEVHEVYRRWRVVAEEYDPPKLLLGETWVFPVEHMARYYGQGDELQLAFNFPFLFSDFTAPGLAGVVGRTFAALPPGACPVWTASNHDVSRIATRWAGGDPRKARLALLILLTLPGTVVLYYGDEIGMTDVAVPPGARRDAMTRANAWTRDSARTPMQWSAGPGAGFCPPATAPWLPFGDHRAVNVADQREDPGSVLSLVRDLVALRRAQLSSGVADYETLALTEHCWAYRSGSLTVAANLSGEPAELTGMEGQVTLHTGCQSPARAGGSLRLGPWHGAVLKSA